MNKLGNWNTNTCPIERHFGRSRGQIHVPLSVTYTKTMHVSGVLKTRKPLIYMCRGKVGDRSEKQSKSLFFGQTRNAEQMPFLRDKHQIVSNKKMSKYEIMRNRAVVPIWRTTCSRHQAIVFVRDCLSYGA